MERHRGYRHRHHEHRHSDFHQHHADRNQFNNHSHYNHEQVSGEVNEPFCSGGLRSNGRKRGRFHSPDYSDGGVDAKLYIAPIPRTTAEENEALLIKLVMLLLHLQYLPVPKWWVRKSVIGVGILAQMVSSLRDLLLYPNAGFLDSSKTPRIPFEKLDRVQIQSETSPAIDPTCV